mgnify:CR=1 FL=1
MGHFNPILVIILIIRAMEISGGNYGFMTSVKNVFPYKDKRNILNKQQKNTQQASIHNKSRRYSFLL